MPAPCARVIAGSGGRAEVYVLSEQEKQIGRSTFENGRLSFPDALALEGDPVAMDVADLDGDKSAEIVYVARTKPGVDSFELRGLERSRRRAEIEEMGSGRVGRAQPALPRCRRRSRRWTSIRTAAATC